MVVEPAENFDIDVVGEAVVSEVGLPAFVGLVGLETDVGRLWSFLWFECDGSGATQDAVNCRW